MTGHKYVSSTERYRTDNLEDLQKEMENYHPLKWRNHSRIRLKMNLSMS